MNPNVIPAKEQSAAHHKAISYTIRILWGFAKPYSQRIMAATALLIVSVILRLTVPILMKKIIDEGIPSESTEQIITLLPILLAVIILSPLLYSLANYLTAWIGQAVAAQLRQRVFDNLIRQDMTFYDEANSGEIVMETMQQVARAALSTASLNLTQIIGDGTLLIVSVVILLSLDIELTLIALIAFPVFFLPIKCFSARATELSAAYLALRNEMTTTIDETVRGIRLVTIMNRQPQRSDLLRDVNRRMVRLWAKTVTYDSLSEMWFTHILQAVGLVVVFAAGAFAVLAGDITIGGLVAFLTYTPWIYAAISTLIRTRLEWDKNQVYLSQALHYMTIEPQVRDTPDAQSLPQVRGEIQFEAVTFTYRSREDASLRNISFRVRPGELVAFVGASGSGKSTLIELLVRYYDVEYGVIRLDGLDIRNIRLNSLRDAIALVPQSVFLFNDTIYNNLVFGGEQVSETQVKEAAQVAQIQDFIEALPEGYATVVGEQGIKLSAGERQRIAIARAWLRDSPILALDEATSAVDLITERKLQDTLLQLRGKKTLLVIAHRLSTIVAADCIYVLAAGQIVEAGTHADLLSQNGAYARLYQAQQREKTTSPAIGD